MDSQAFALVVLVVLLLPLFFLIRISAKISESNRLLQALLDQRDDK